MTPIATYALFAMFGLSLGILVGYYLHWLEYRPITGYIRAAKKYERLKENIERSRLK